MKKSIKLLALAPMMIVLAGSLTSCGSEDNYLELRVINSEDYIYLNDPTDPESLPNLTTQFEQSEMVKDFLDTYYPGQYQGVRVIYDTSDTNETLYSELQTGKSNYDLMNVSDYMAQKIVASGMAVPLYQHGATIENYKTYASPYIRGVLDSIEATQKSYDSTLGKLVYKTVKLEDYAVGYMWGTLGILFNPEYPGFNGLSKDRVIHDMYTFDTLWDSAYKGTISIKNSMRDTYAIGLLHALRDDFAEIKSWYEEGEDDKGNPYTVDNYRSDFSALFNQRSDRYTFEESLNLVKTSLDSLKENIFGLEVDSGKQDIITKKIGVNVAWSGDAVYSMDQGEDLTQVTEEVTLYYSIPELGSNIWMDAWIMPNCQRTDAQYKLAHLFLDFLCDPTNATQNMDYTGYTSFIGGDAIIDLVRDWYDVRTEEVYFGDEGYQIYSANPVTKDDPIAIDFVEDFSISRDTSRNEDLLYAFVPYIPEGEEEEVEEPLDYDDLINHSEIVPSLDDEGNERVDENDEIIQKTYEELLIVDNGDYAEVDLTYFFDGSGLDVYGGDDRNMIFYAEEYYSTYIDNEGNEVESTSVGRQFYCQYPDLDTINRCAVMEDYQENNKFVMTMWEDFKSDPLPLWAIIVFAVLGAGLVGVASYFITNSVLKKRTKKKRIQN